MIGALVYVLRAEHAARLPLVNGRLMHAAFFKILNNFSKSLGDLIHNECNLKPFTVSFLEPAEKIPSIEDNWSVRRGDLFFWRVTGLNAEILQAALSVPVNEKIQVGSLSLRVVKMICDGNIRDDTGVVTIKDFIAAAKKFPPAKEINFNFISPVSFRIDDFDAPYPRPELIFPSLADKWTQAAMPAAVDKKVIRERAAQIRLTYWRGESKVFHLSQNRGTLAFCGNFVYDIGALSPDVHKVFILLSKFGEFAGVGRLSGQGFGQVRISFESQFFGAERHSMFKLLSK